MFMLQNSRNQILKNIFPFMKTSTVKAETRRNFKPKIALVCVVTVLSFDLLYASSLPPFVESRKLELLTKAKKFFLESSPEFKGLKFLIDHMSTVDLINIAPEDLFNHVRYSFKARDLMAWGRSVPETVFLEYVLFHKAAQEPFEPYRPPFFSKLAPLVYNSKSMREAALIVNRWVGSQVLARPSSTWDIGPIGLILRGFGRCEELSILLVSALRSVAIPARIAWIPAWRHVDGNHAWVEVYLDDNKWHFLDAGSPQQDFDRPWFAPFLSQVPVVWVASPNNVSCPENVAYGRAFLCNETERYTETERVNIHVKNSFSSDISVSLLVWNSGRLRPVITGKPNKNKVVQFRVGRGAYVVEVAKSNHDDKNDKFSSWSLRKLLCIQDLKGDITVYLDNEAANFFRCRLPIPKNLLFDNVYPGMDLTKTEEFVSSLRSIILSWHPDIDENLSEHLSEMGTNVFDLLTVIDDLSDEEFSTLKDMLRLVDPKGLATVSPGNVIEHVRKALDRKRKIKQFHKEPGYEKEIFRNFVINPQFQDFPPFWFSEKLKFTDADRKISFPEIIKKALKISRSIIYIQPEFFGSPFTLENIVRYKISHSRREFLVGLGALLRLHGIATMYDEVTDRLLVHNGKGWQVFDFGATSPERALIPLEVPGEVVVKLIDGEGVCPVYSRPSYGVDFSFTKLNAGKRIFVKNPIIIWNEADCSFHIKLFPGTYEFSVGRRIFSSDGNSEYPSEIDFFLTWIDVKSAQKTLIRYSLQ